MRVLVVDDEPISATVAAAIVRRLGHEATTARNGEDAWRRLQADDFDVVLSDREMPVVDGLELCRRLRSEQPSGVVGRLGDRPARYTYLILVTSHDSWADALVGMRAGADDYLGKPLDPAQLELRLIAAQRVTDLHRSLERQQQGLVELSDRQYALARNDALTGLPNRRALEEDLRHLRARASRHDRGFSVAVLDVDHFKSLNDTAGHLEGDRVLTLVAAALSAQVRAADGLYRYGGEEFVLVLDTEDVAGARCGADRLRQAVEDLRLPHPGRPGEVVTLSAGTALHDPSDPDPDATLGDADAALYRAKQQGRNRTCQHEVPDSTISTFGPGAGQGGRRVSLESHVSRHLGPV